LNIQRRIFLFLENNIDGSILMSNKFDENIIKDRIVFDIARKSLYQKVVDEKNMKVFNQRFF
jgi:hypothetical protein